MDLDRRNNCAQIRASHNPKSPAKWDFSRWQFLRPSNPFLFKKRPKILDINEDWFYNYCDPLLKCIPVRGGAL